MAKVFGQSSDLSGKVGNITYMQTKYGTVAFPSKKKAKVPLRSERQMEVRTQWVNLGAIYRQFHETLKKSFENVGQMSAYNAFVQANINVTKVFISKQDKLNGGSVLAPYLITRGSLDSIEWAVNGTNVLMTNLSLGSLTIDDATTVGQVSQAVISNNVDWKQGDQIAFFSGTQVIDAVTSTPRARILGYKVVLDVNNTQALWSVVNKLGFCSVEGADGSNYLGMATAITNGAAAWVHSRDKGNSLQVSSQFLYVDSNILQSYMDGSAFDVSANSYGGINTSAVFLDPGTGSDNGSGVTVNGSDPWDNAGTQTPTGGTGSVTPSGPKLTINRTGNGTATVTANGSAVTSGSEVAANTEVSISITPAEGATPTATLNSNSVTLTENDGVYTGTFTMPGSNATLSINSGGTTGGGSHDMN